jgi:hypothetical protein
MTLKCYELSDEFLETSQSLTLWKSEKSIVEVEDNTPVIQLILDEDVRGYIFGGKGRLVVDTIIETDRGAIGKPVERDITDPFLMMGNTSAIQESLRPLDKEKFTDLKVISKEKFREKAEELLDQFFADSSCRRKRSSFKEVNGFVFAFPNEKNELDILLCKDYKLVFTSSDKVFVSKGKKEILTSHGEVVVSKPGRSIFVSKGESSKRHIHRSRT